MHSESFCNRFHHLRCCNKKVELVRAVLHQQFHIQHYKKEINMSVVGGKKKSSASCSQRLDAACQSQGAFSLDKASPGCPSEEQQQQNPPLEPQRCHSSNSCQRLVTAGWMESMKNSSPGEEEGASSGTLLPCGCGRALMHFSLLCLPLSVLPTTGLQPHHRPSSSRADGSIIQPDRRC